MSREDLRAIYTAKGCFGGFFVSAFFLSIFKGRI
jgi:hypothetical protein